MTQQQKNIYLFFWIGICACIIALYWFSLDSPFVYDDKIEVIGNRTIRDISDWKAIASYNPSRILLQFSYALNLHYSKFDPFDYHVLNLIIHCLSSGAALWMCVRLHALLPVSSQNRSFPLFPFLVVGLWALHPMGSESVIYITGRSESLCATFSFLAIGCWATGIYKRENASIAPTLLWFASGFLCSVCAGTTKEVGLMIPFVLFMMEWIFRKKIHWKYYIPFVLFVLAGISLRFIGLQAGLEEGESSFAAFKKMIPKESDRSMGAQLLTQAEVWIRYTLLWLFPYKQTIFHHIPDRIPTNGSSYYGVIAWFSLGTILWKMSTNAPISRFALIAGTLLLLPSSSLVPLKENMAEHRAHQWGLFVFLYIFSLRPLPNNLYTAFAPLLLVIPIGFATYKRTEVWSSEYNIWKEAVDRNPKSAEAWYGYGDSLRFYGKVVESKEAFEKCVELDSAYLDGWINLGITRAQTNDIVGAAKAWKTVLKQKPEVWKPSHCKAHNNLGFLGARAKEWDDALNEFHSTLSICPDDLLAHYALGEIHFEPRFDKKKAIYYYERLLYLDPTFDKAEEVRKKLLKLTW